MLKIRNVLACMACVAVVGCGNSATVASGATPAYAVPVPEVSGPIGDAGIHGHPLWDSFYDLADLGYDEQEYFVSGTAKTYTTPSTTAPYTTRIIVRRPLDPAKFNGTVILDWVNVTAQFENAVDTLEAHQLFVRDGYAYVHVSAQAAGVCCLPELTPKMWDPVRYMALSHPGDDYAYDMFSQIAQAMKHPPAVDPMAGLHVQKIIAVGQSQSGTYLRNYLIKVQPEARVIDAFLIHSDGDGDKIYPADPAVPTIQLFSEREATPVAPNVSHNYRLWEVAGAAHQDFWVGYHQIEGEALRVLADTPKQPGSADAALHVAAGNYGEQIDPGQLVCIVQGTQFPLRYVVMVAIHDLDRWIKTGVEPPEAPRYQFDGNTLARDQYSNALGGIRLPPIEVPVATYRSDICNLGGITIPFTVVQLQQLYPTHADYYCKMKAATQRSVDQGFLLPEDAVDLMDRVKAAKNRWLVAGTPDC
ncbi:MAG TPA: alpha/beta hydrolase domain-containing protein [Stenotrophobium sp.]|jgi:hypothetical protein|nr:alpha/beta hydrolase domain-containing protein [Stenotrophobium sp.]